MDLLVTADWLADNLSRKDIKILDGTWVLPNEAQSLAMGFIPGAQIFDIDAIADLKSDMKHMLPSAKNFAAGVSNIGINNSDHVICYDRHGLFSSPRVWWTFMTFGHSRVSILDGGLPAWIKADHIIHKSPLEPQNKSEFKTGVPHIEVTDKNCLLSAIGTEIQIVDARPSGRFLGTSPEPREGLRSGRIPGSFSLPFGTLKTSDGFFKPIHELATIVGQAGINLEKPIITSCGSGITAAGVAFVLHSLGAKEISLYDGSWAEWGASDAPIEI
ncbi:3-mercaptopyruvate sulfurtransferase [Hellea balneolensis]|uniref:3-mercaptopyruvate sulfurtransferase n=1 Tax=Hellea balneolensis TaxID=287478 RepID=UPI0003F5184A|nr:3-mercaptopyruvate sulfurtransferase [Hellea balneolensis]